MGTGIVESVIVNTKVHTLGAAFQIASALLSHYGSDAVVLDCDTLIPGLAPGQMLTCNLADYGLVGKQTLINSVSISDEKDSQNIWFHIQAVGSPLEAAQWQTYYQNLMNQSADPSDLADTTDTSLALLLDSVITRAPTATVHATHAVCAICSTSGMICGQWTVC